MCHKRQPKQRIQFYPIPFIHRLNGVEPWECENFVYPVRSATSGPRCFWSLPFQSRIGLNCSLCCPNSWPPIPFCIGWIFYLERSFCSTSAAIWWRLWCAAQVYWANRLNGHRMQVRNYGDCVRCVRRLRHHGHGIAKPAMCAFWNETIIACSQVSQSSLVLRTYIVFNVFSLAKIPIQVVALVITITDISCG